MMFDFTEEIADDILDELVRELEVGVVVAQYKIESEISLDTYDFQDEGKYRLFFEYFAEYANERWKLKTNVDWDFSMFPFRESSDILSGLYRILKTGSAYGNLLGDEESARIEEKYRKGLQKDSNSLIIFCAVGEDFRGEDVGTGFGVPDDMLELATISSFFELVAWDGLMIVINPEFNRLYVIAFTDSD
ncbi:MAG: hypothetical protein RTU30_14655 [Candidatus Thorarchaeota archaeon]